MPLTRLAMRQSNKEDEMKTFVQNGNQSPAPQQAAEKARLPPIAPPYCDPDDYPHPETVNTRKVTALADSPMDNGLNPFPGWANSKEEFMVDL